MKTKKQRLALNKKTITSLNNVDLVSVVGGRTVYSCPPDELCASENNGCYSPTDGCQPSYFIYACSVTCPGN